MPSFIKNSNVKDENWEKKFSHVSNFCRGTAHNTLGKDKSQLIESYEELIKLALDINDIDLADKTKQKLKNLYNRI